MLSTDVPSIGVPAVASGAASPIAVCPPNCVTTGGSGFAGFAGAYAGFRLVLPSDPHCGLAVLPAMFFGGGLGGFVGLAFGLTAGAMLKRASATPPPK